MTYLATYHRGQLPEYQGNPLLEALPPICDDAETLRAMTNYPPSSPDDRRAPAHLRIHMLDRLPDLFQAQPEHLKIARMVSRLIRAGYKSRNPLLPTHTNYGYQLATKELDSLVRPHGYAIFRKASLLTGLSGLGKSTTLERALASIPQVITHKKYRGKPFIQTQIPYIKLDCPHDGSLRTYLLSMLSIIDDLVPGYDYFEQWSRVRSGIEALIPAVFRILHNLHVGLLLTDELNLLTSAPRGGKKKFMNLSLNINNKLGIPQFYSGTNEAAKLFKFKVRNSRRVSFGGRFHLERYEMTDRRWDLFFQSLWRYQYTKTPIPATPEMSRALYDASQAITDFAVNIYICVQEAAIRRGGDETFDANDLVTAVPIHLPILQPAIDALRRGDEKAYEQFRELLPPAEHWRADKEPEDERAKIDSLVETLVQQGVAAALAEREKQGEPQAAAKAPSGDEASSDDMDATEGDGTNEMSDTGSTVRDIDSDTLRVRKSSAK